MTEDATSKRDLSKLEDTYEILSTVHEDGASATHLARHRELGRDVTITVVHMPDGGEHNTLTHFASDARLLSGTRHERIVPVLEGRWLDDDTFAVVRVLARGSTLAETLSQSGPFSPKRTAETLEQVNEGLEWARQSGVVHRTVTAETVGFQQGSGRVMMSLGLSPLSIDSLPDACSDARTIGSLAWSMLAGRSFDGATTDDRTLADLRPGLSAKVVAETEALLACEDGGEARDLAGYIALLTAEREAPAPAPQAPAAGAAVAAAAPASAAAAAVTGSTKARPATVTAPNTSEPRIVVTPSRVSTPPVGAFSSADAPVVVRRRFRSPIAAAFVVAALIIVAAFAVLKWQRDRTQSRFASGDVDSSALLASGHTSPMEAPPPPLPAGSARPPEPTIDSSMMVTPVSPMPISPTTAYPTPMPAAVAPNTQPIAAPIVTPARPTTVDTTRTPVRDTTPSTPTSTDPCASSDPGDQRACFNAAIAKNDVELNRAYSDAIVAMRRRANVGDSDPDPESVRELRAVQRRWVEERDAECRRRGEGREGVQWAQSRAQCFAELSAERTRQLVQMRDSIP